MCGLIGCASTDDVERLAAVEAGLGCLRHRGPESQRAAAFRTADRNAVLGHTRLRIIDLHERADQPIANEDGSVQVTFNGELYNFGELRTRLRDEGHTFASETDTEVLVHLYESVDGDPDRLLSQLRGMFAFALFDTKRGRLLLARDRLGIKPMYHAKLAGGGVAFASEASALVESGLVSPGPDTLSVVGYLLWGSVQGPRSIFAGIQELPAGSYLVWQGDEPRVHEWWQPSFEPRIPDAEATNALRDVLEDGVARHLVADREVGLFLSGGVDSGSIAAVAARRGSIRSLTVTFPDIGDDEGPAAMLVAKRLGLHHEDVAVVGSDVAGWLPSVVGSMDQPTNDGVNSWIVSKAAHDAGLVVALSGVGGDELFGGYPSFSLVPRVKVAASALGWAPMSLRRRSADALVARRPGARASRVLMAMPGSGGAYRAVRGLFSARDLDRLGVLRWIGESDAIDTFTPPDPDVADPIDAVACLEMQRYLRNQLLRDTDAMSMAHSLEVRVPLLDDAVVQAATGIASRVRNRPGKELLLAAAGVNRHGAKRGFTLPFDAWMRGPLKEPLRELVLSDALPFEWLFERDARRSLWRSFEAGHVHWSRPWALGVLRFWAAEHDLRW
jgi:asparagine synthase (glutamine-hydrolysing)